LICLKRFLLRHNQFYYAMNAKSELSKFTNDDTPSNSTKFTKVSNVADVVVFDDVAVVTASIRKSFTQLRTVNRKERYLDAAEATRLRDYVELHHRDAVCLLIGFLMYTGARRHEVFTAEWQHINLERNSWYVPVTKNGKPRYVMLNRRAVQIIEYARLLQTQQYIHKPQWLFINPHTHKPYRCVFSKWSRIRAELGLHDVRIHDLRHSFASTLVNNGATLYEVQKLLGHARSATTERYAHLANHRLQQAVSLIDKAYE
jgi:integrase